MKHNHQHNQRNSEHNQRNPDHVRMERLTVEDESTAVETIRSYGIRRVAEGWELTLVLLPLDVASRYAVKSLPVDVLPIVLAKLESDVARVASGLPGMERL